MFPEQYGFELRWDGRVGYGQGSEGRCANTKEKLVGGMHRAPFLEEAPVRSTVDMSS